MKESAFHRYESAKYNRWYAGGRWKGDGSLTQESKIVFEHPFLAEPLCGWEWYKAHYDREYPEPVIEIAFDDKPLITVNGNYKRGLIKDTMRREIDKHQPKFWKYGRKKIFDGYFDDNVLPCYSLVPVY